MATASIGWCSRSPSATHEPDEKESQDEGDKDQQRDSHSNGSPNRKRHVVHDTARRHFLFDELHRANFTRPRPSPASLRETSKDCRSRLARPQVAGGGEVKATKAPGQAAPALSLYRRGSRANLPVKLARA